MAATQRRKAVELGVVRQLIRDTLWIRDLHRRCLRRGIPMNHLSAILCSARTLAEQGYFENAAHRLREAKMDLLAELLLAEQVPPEDRGLWAQAWDRPLHKGGGEPT